MNKKGFTLIEVLVVTAIIVIISAFMAVNFRKGEEGRKLQRTAQQIAQDIRKAQNLALSSTEYAAEVPVEGYGARFRTQDINSYTLFADTLNDSSCGYPGSGTISNPSLEQGIEIDSLYTYTTAPGIGMVSRTVIHACFIPPDPQTAVSPAGSGVGGVIINIRKSGANCIAFPVDCGNIVVNKVTGTVSTGSGAIK